MVYTFFHPLLRDQQESAAVGLQQQRGGSFSRGFLISPVNLIFNGRSSLHDRVKDKEKRVRVIGLHLRPDQAVSSLQEHDFVYHGHACQIFGELLCLSLSLFSNVSFPDGYKYEK